MKPSTLTRLQAEFTEMPGLCLTTEQARRLFDLDADQCATVLAQLVDRGVLQKTARGQYVRSSAP
jgi:predicted transcriptional regulator of viral defense system